MSRSYTGKIQVRFGEVDGAGIVYYPRIFDYFHQVFETFFERKTAVSYPELIRKRRLGFPSVRYEVDFRSPLKYGDKLPVHFSAVRIGRTSVTFRYEILRGSKVLVRALGTTVCVDMDTFKPVPIPSGLRRAFGAILSSEITAFRSETGSRSRQGPRERDRGI